MQFPRNPEVPLLLPDFDGLLLTSPQLFPQLYNMTEWGLSKKAFWDVRFEDIDFDKHARFVIEKVFNYGTWSDQIAIMNFYGMARIKAETLEISYLRPTVVSYLSALLKVPKSAFKCYVSKQFQQIPWNS